MDHLAWLSAWIVGLVAVALAVTRVPADLILVAGLTALIAVGALTPVEALSGLGNPALATVGVLYVVVSGLVETGAVRGIGERILGRPGTEAAAQLRVMLPAATLSAFLNNTPVVAMMIPAIQDLARRQRLAVSKLMIPLSYGAIFGGSCTIIGTSTNLILAGLAVQGGMRPIEFFEIAWVGVPTAVAGIIFILATSRWLLPRRQPVLPDSLNARKYAIEMLVDPSSTLVGRTIEEAGLRHLPAVYLAEIERAGSVIPAVAPTERLHGGDRAVFVGDLDSIVDLYRIRGLIPAAEQVFKLDAPRPERGLIEVVISESSPVAGRTIRDSRFRTRYEAVVLAVARGGTRVPGKIGDIELRGGDTLLLEARPSFVDQHRRSRDFLLVSGLSGATPPRHDRSAIAIGILAAMIVAATVFRVDMLLAALCAAGLMIATRCTTGSVARAAVDWQVLTVIGASLGLGKALEQTGAAAALSHAGLDLAGGSPLAALVAVYLITSVLTGLVTNNAAAVLMFPIAQAAASELGVSLAPFVLTIMMAASASFATPIGYQTNLMVYGPGGYRFTDYLRIGLPLNVLFAIITAIVAPVVWPFMP